MPRAKKVTQPVQGQAYGKQVEQARQLAAVPAGSGEGQTPPPAPGVDMGQAIQSAQAAPFENLDLYGPTQNPDEPLTAGMPFGAGPGPEVLTKPDPLFQVLQAMNALGEDADPETKRIREMMQITLAQSPAGRAN